MEEGTRRGLLIGGLVVTLLLLALVLLDNAYEWGYHWYIFAGWGLLLVAVVLVALSTASWRSERPDDAAPALARAVASLSARPVQPPATAKAHDSTPLSPSRRT